MKKFTNQAWKINTFIEDLQKNKRFAQNIVFHMSSLQKILHSSDPDIDSLNAKELLQHSFLNMMQDFLLLHYQNESFIISSGEIILCLCQILIKDTADDHDMMMTIHLFLEKLCNMNSAQIGNFIKAFHIIINKSKDIELSEPYRTNQLLFIMNLLSNTSNALREETQCLLLELIIDLLAMQSFPQETQIKLLKDIIAISSLSTVNKIAMNCLKIIHSLMTYQECRNYFREISPITFIMNIISKYPTDSSLSLQSCNILLLIIDKNDIYSLVSILKNNSFDYNNMTILEEHSQKPNDLSEIKTLLQSENESYIKTLKENITRLLILLSQEKQFLILLQEIKSLDLFINILKADLELMGIYKQMDDFKSNDVLIQNNILPEISLILSLLKNTIEDNSDINYDNSTLIKDEIHCLIKSLSLVISNEDMAKDIILYLSFLIKKKFFETEGYELLTEEFESLLGLLLENYYMKAWFYDFITNFPIQSIIRNSQIIKREMNYKISKPENENISLNGDIHQLQKVFESYHLIQSDEKRYEFNALIHKISIKLYLGKNMSNRMSRGIFNDSSFQILNHYCNKMIQKFNEANSIFNTKTKDYFITLIFAGLENMTFGDHLNELKCSLLVSLIEKMNILNEYFIMCLVRLTKSDIEDDKAFYQKIFLNNALVKMIFHNFNLLTNIQSKSDSIIIMSQNTKTQSSSSDNLSLMKNILIILNTIISISCDKEDIKLSAFLQEDGIINIINLSKDEEYMKDKEIINHLLKVIQNISSDKHFKESVIVYKNNLLLEKLFLSYKSIAYYGKNNDIIINEDVYYELMYYLKKVLKSCDLSSCNKVTAIIEFLMNEIKMISAISQIDISNQSLQIILDILSVISMNGDIIATLINDHFALSAHLILSKLKNNDKQNYDENTFRIFITLVNSMIKSKEQSKIVYYHLKWKECFNIIKEIIAIHFNHIKDLVKIMGYCTSVVLFEKEYKIVDKIYTIAYFNELIKKIDQSNNNEEGKCTLESGAGQMFLVREMINRCILLLENYDSEALKQHTSKENDRMYQDLSSSMKITTHKRNAIRIKRNNNSTEITKTISTEEDSIDNTQEKAILSKFNQNQVDLSTTFNTKAKFDHICIKIISCMDIITDKTKSNMNLKDESKELLELLNLLYLFIRNEDNIPMIFDSDILVALLPILNNPDITEETQEKLLTFIQAMISKEKYHYKLLENAKICNYFLEEMSYIGKTYTSSPGSSLTIKNIQTIASIISILSLDKSFLINNSKLLSEQKLIGDIKTVMTDKDITCTLMQIFHNILLNNDNSDFTSNPKALGELLILIWTSFPKEQILLSHLYSIIERAYGNKIFLDFLISNADIFTLQILSLFNEKHFDTNFIGQSFTLINLLIDHDAYAKKLIEKNFYVKLFQIVDSNIFNTKILEQFLSFLLKSLRREPSIAKVMFSNVINEFCMKIIKKYYITCHKHIILTTLEIIFILLNDKEHMSYYASVDSMDILLQAFKANLQTKEEVSFFLRLFNLITITVTRKGQGKEVFNEIVNRKSLPNNKKNIQKTNVVPTAVTKKAKKGIIEEEINEKDSNDYQYDFVIFSEIISDIIEKYAESIDVIFMVYELIKNIYDLTDEPEIKVSLILLLLKFGNDAVLQGQIESIEITLEILVFITDGHNTDVDNSTLKKCLTYNCRSENNAFNILDTSISSTTNTLNAITNTNIINQNKGINSNNTGAYLEGSLFLYFINEILKKINYNEHIILLIITLLKSIIRDPKFKKTAITREIILSLTYLIENDRCQCDNIIMAISRVLAILCEKLKPIKGISYDFIFILFNYISDSQKLTNMSCQVFILEQLKIIVAYLQFDSDEKENMIALSTLLHQFYQIFVDHDEMKCLGNLFQIISTISLQSEIIQQSFQENDLISDIKEKIDNNFFTDQVIEYKAKGCLLNLKPKNNQSGLNLIRPYKNRLKVKNTSLDLTPIEDNVKIFLLTERNVKLYKIDGTIIKLVIKMEDDLREIRAYTKEKKGIKIEERMDVIEMDSCVRSASTIAFRNAKGFFVKKPKPTLCFSILGRSVLNQQQRSFNVECNNESECISYVDYISILINNTKAEQLHNLHNQLK